MKFKVGDIVICTDSSGMSFLHNNGFYEVQTVSENPAFPDGTITLKGFHSFGIADVCRFELAEPQYTWTSKFNIGDKVIDKNGIVFVIRLLKIDIDGIVYIGDCNSRCEEVLSLYKEPKTYDVIFANATKEDIIEWFDKYINE